MKYTHSHTHTHTHSHTTKPSCDFIIRFLFYFKLKTGNYNLKLKTLWYQNSILNIYYIKYQDWNDFFAKIWGLGLMRWPKKNESYLNYVGVCVCVVCTVFAPKLCKRTSYRTAQFNQLLTIIFSHIFYKIKADCKTISKIS